MNTAMEQFSSGPSEGPEPPATGFARLSRATPTRPLRPRVVVAWIWMVAALLSLYGAPSIRDWLRTAGDGQEQGWRPALGDLLVRLSDATGLSRVRDALEGEGEKPPVVPATAPIAPPPATAAPAVAPSAPVRKVLLVGASTIQFHLGVQLEKRLPERNPGVTVVRLGKLSTGLTRPDVFDWPAAVQELLQRHRPDLLIANFGGNDAQAMVLDDGRIARFGKPEWESNYQVRVARIVEIGRAAGARVLLMGMSTTRDPSLSRRMARINALTEEVARQRGAAFLSIWDIGADSGGNYQDTTVVDKVPIRTRLADGKHFSRTGAAWATELILDRLGTVVPLLNAGVN
jgi:uncharacterized protein